MIEEVHEGRDAWQTLEDVMKDADAQDAVLSRFKKQEDTFKETTIALKNYGNALKDLGSRSLNGEDISNELIKAKSALEEYAVKLRELAESGQLERHSDDVIKLQTELSQLDDNLPADQIVAKLELIAGQLRGISSNAS